MLDLVKEGLSVKASKIKNTHDSICHFLHTFSVRVID